MVKELTNKQMDQVDTIESIVYDAMYEIVGKDISNHASEWLWELTDKMVEIAVEYYGCNEQELYPYIEN